MRLLLLGKRGSITHWLEDCAAAWRADGHEVRVAVVRDPWLHPALDALSVDRRLGAPRAAAITALARHFAPTLMIAVGAYHVAPVLLEHLAALPGRAPLLGWVGDRFEPAAAEAARFFDAVAYTDSGLLGLHRDLGVAAPASWLPHGVDPHGVPVSLAASPRRAMMAFVANPTAHRRRVVAALASPIAVWGPGWAAATPSATQRSGGGHEVHARRVSRAEVRRIHAGHRAALNIRNELNVLAGLNQRNFDPYLTATPVVTDAQADLERCFEPGREVLVWRDTDELNAIHARLLADPALAARVGAAGERRVRAEHTLGRRLEALARLVAV